MGRKNSELTAVITADIKDRTGITVYSGLTLGSIALTEKGFKQITSFSYEDCGELKANKVIDSIYEDHYTDVIYPAIQILRYLMPYARINITITVTGHTPYIWRKTKYYTGEYITFSYSLPFKTRLDAYYVSRAILCNDSMSTVQANMQNATDVFMLPKDYATKKSMYKKACQYGMSQIQEMDKPFDQYNLAKIMDYVYIDLDALATFVDYEDKMSKYTYTGAVVIASRKSWISTPLFLDDEGYFDIEDK